MKLVLEALVAPMVIVSVGFISGTCSANRNWRQEVISKGYAAWVITDKVTGDKEFKWNCDREESDDE